MDQRIRRPERARPLGCALGLVLAGCSGKGGDTTAPDPDPAAARAGTGAQHDPDPAPGPTPDPTRGRPGQLRPEQINNSQPGQLVTIANPDGTVIGLYRFDAADDAGHGRASDLRPPAPLHGRQGAVRAAGRGRVQAGRPRVGGRTPSHVHLGHLDDAFTGVVLGDIVAIKYDFDGDGEAETSFGFQRTD